MSTLIIEDYNRKDVFEIIDEFPHGYVVWNIGRRNFPFKGYIPLAKPTNVPYNIDLHSLKAIKTGDDLADYILKEAGRREINKDEFQRIISSLTRCLWATTIQK